MHNTINQPLVSINLVVLNGIRYVRTCLEAVRKQNYPNLELNVLDNHSTDGTTEIIQKEYPEFKIFRQDKNLGVWPGHEKLLEKTNGKYIVALSVDVILDPSFVKQAVEVLESDEKIGALQPKIYQYSIEDLLRGNKLPRKIIDTCGFAIQRSRRITNIGHGEEDRGQHDQASAGEIFGVEGAAPVLRRSMIEDIRVEGHFADEDFFWYGDDLDFAWRMHLFGWKQVFASQIVAHHDRQTTKTLRKSKIEFIRLRRKLPFFKRALDFRNTIFTMIKNDYLENVFHDIFPIFKRHIPLWGYFLVFEPKMIFQLISIVRMLPRMVQKRRIILQRARITPREIHTWFFHG